jgi:putative transposase
MGRQPRLFVPGLPHHVVQRGHNHNAVFVESADYEYYLKNLIEWKSHYDVGVYAYCLMTNHVHLILVPNTICSDISGLMRRLSARQGRRVNRLEERIGTLWSGRFKSSVVDSDRYLLACLRYVELNPVRAGIAARPQDYMWSSYLQRISDSADRWIDADPITATLGSTQITIRRAYIDFIESEVPTAELKLIRGSLTRNQLTGGSRFVDEIERRTGIRVEFRGPGRPGK